MENKSGFEGLDPFVVKRVIPLDLAPHSLRCDMVILCERLSANKIPKSSRPTAKSAKATAKINSSQKKNWHNSTTSSGRSNLFPTEEMVRRYSSNLRKPKQEIDYQKRDSLYPLPLRGALYQGSESEIPHYPNDRYAHRGQYHNEPNYYSKTAVRNDVRDLARFSDFRQDMENALEETPYYSPGKQLTSRKLAYANALLEEGIRLASEVLDTDYTRVSSSTGLHGKPKIPNSNYKYRY